MAQYGEVRVDYITYTTGTFPTEANATVTVSSLVNDPTFSGDVQVGGDVTITGNLNVLGDSVFDDITVSGNSTLNTLTVTGSSNLEDVEISGTLTVTGTTNLESLQVSGGLTVTGDTNLNTLTVTGAANLESLEVSGGLTVTGDTNLNTLTVTGSSNLENAEISGTLTVTGNTELNTLTVTGNTNLNTLTATGAVNLESLEVSGGLTVTGDTNLNTLTVTGSSNLESLQVSGGLTVTGNTNLNTLTVTGTTNLESLQVSDGLTVTGNTDLNTLTVTGNSQLENVEISGTLTVTGNTFISGDLTVGGVLDASGITLSGFTGLFASGTEASPSISFEGDDDTGLYNPLANQIGISVSGVEKIRINSDGYVGLGVDLSVEPNVLLAPLDVDNLNGVASSGQAAIIHCDGINDRRFKLASLKGSPGVSQADIGSIGCFYNPSGNTAASGYVTNALIDFKRGGSTDDGYMGFRTASGNAGFIYSNGNWIIGDKEDAENNNASNTTALHIYKPDPVLTIQDTESELAAANATLRLAESNASTGHVAGYWDVKAAPNTNGGFKFIVNPYSNGDNNTFVINRNGSFGMNFDPSPTGVEEQALVVNKSNQGIRVQNIVYTNSQDAPYLIASSSNWTGASTNWGTFGFQHKIKSNSTGTSRITIDTYLGEFFCMNNTGNSCFGGGDSNPDVPLVVSKTNQETLARFENNVTGAGTVAAIELRHGGTSQCRARLVSERDGQNAGAGYLLQSTNSAGTLMDRYRCNENGKHVIQGQNIETTNNNGTLVLSQSTTQISTIGSGPILHFAGWTGNSARSYAGIAGVKYNATANDFDGGLMFYTRLNGVADLRESARISPPGYVGINEINPETFLHVYSNMSGGGFDRTAILGRGSDSNFQLTAANGSNTNANGQAVGRIGIYYKSGSSPDWDTHIDFIRGGGANNGTIEFKTAGSSRLTLSTTSSTFSGGITVNGGITCSNNAQIVGQAPQLYFGETGSPGAGQLWAIVRDGDSLSMRWKNAAPYGITCVTDGTNVQSISLRGNAFQVDTNNRINLGSVASPSAVANSVCCSGRLQAQGSYSGTTADAANLNINNAGIILRSTSSIRFKTEVETLEDNYADALLKCRPVWYRSTCKDDRSDYSHYGFIAEEVAEIDPRLVHWEENEFVTESAADIEGSGPDETTTKTVKLDKPIPGGVAYERFVPALVNIINRQKDAIAELEKRLSSLENKL